MRPFRGFFPTPLSFTSLTIKASCGIWWIASSRDPGCAGMAHSTALLQARLRAKVWYEYVASAANIADLPSRGDFSFVRRMMAPVGGMFRHVPCHWFDSTIPSFGW